MFESVLLGSWAFTLIFPVLFCGLISAAIAGNKGFSKGNWFLAGILLGPFGILWALIKSKNESFLVEKAIASGISKKCPYCAEIVKVDATVCRYCHRDLPKNESEETTKLSLASPKVTGPSTGMGSSRKDPSMSDDYLADMHPIYLEQTTVQSRATLIEPHQRTRNKSGLVIYLVAMVVIGSTLLFFLAKNNSSGNVKVSSGKPVSSMVAENNPTTQLQKQAIYLNIGPVSITSHSKCSQHECETEAVLHYDNQTLNIDSTGSNFHPLAETEVAWVDNRFVTIYYANGGNCWACEGIDVIALDDNKLFYLGKYSRFEDAYLVKPYDVLELNELTNHADAPFWDQYFKYAKGVVTLDINKTCSVNKAHYATNKNNLLRLFITKVRTELSAIAQPSWWLEDKVTIPLLDSLAFARYCGWQDDYDEIIKVARNSNRLTN